MNQPAVPVTSPVRVAAETFLIPNLAPAGDHYLPVNSLLIRGDQPIVVDTGAPVHHDHWVDMVFGLVDPADVRWVFLSHEDGDHVGALDTVLESAPQATLVTNFFGTERRALEAPVPLQRSVWLEPGETFVAGDRRLRLVLPPIFDGPATRGLFDESTGVLWAVYSFAAMTTGAVHHLDDLPMDLVNDTFEFLNSLVSPWHEWLDPAKYGRHVDAVRSLRPNVVTSAHGPVIVGDAIDDAFARVRALAGQPRHVPPGREQLDQILASALDA